MSQQTPIVLTPYLEIPLEVLSVVRTKREATVLLNIATTARRFDVIQKSLISNRETAQNLSLNQRNGKGMKYDFDNIMSFLSEANSCNEAEQISLSEQLSEVRASFQSCRDLLECHIDSNLAAANEFLEAECIKLAGVKRFIYEFELIMFQRLNYLLGSTTPLSPSVDDGEISVRLWERTLSEQVSINTAKWQ